MRKHLTVAALLALFGGVPDSDLIYPPPAAVRRIVDNLPRKRADYDSLARETAAHVINNPQDSDRFDRTITILRLLLYTDGRTELALLQITEMVASKSTTESFAINPLAGLANYYSNGGVSSLSDSELIQKMDRFGSHEVLFTNAMACKRALLRRGANHRHGGH
jgi:hypothetical protein